MVTLNVLTREDPSDVVRIPEAVQCDGSMTCQCVPCQRDRTERMRPRRPVRQPWERKAA